MVEQEKLQLMVKWALSKHPFSSVSALQDHNSTDQRAFEQTL